MYGYHTLIRKDDRPTWGGVFLPSQALQKFEDNLLVDVDRIIESHSLLNHKGGGRRGLGHITRSGVLMLCAAWELYLEEVLTECVHILIKRVAHPKQLPKPVQKELARAVRESKHELKPLELAADGWMTVYHDHACQTVRGLNTPKSVNVDLLFKRFIGIEALSTCWSMGPNEIDSFVSARGDIAHRGRDAGYVKINGLKDYRTQVVQAVVDTDNTLADFIQTNSEGGSPWRRRNV